ncbi:hypothetical protein SAE02_39100 [Skermanella aerolata]|uniref:Uncharacterized protein n=1 Tax=Skermanella aerolata TaxID=393310 RepID=A0A512DTG2_9PROT|nr:hypothetical protein SAE02_39100 [Skermanella aerolata]
MSGIADPGLGCPLIPRAEDIDRCGQRLLGHGPTYRLLLRRLGRGPTLADRRSNSSAPGIVPAAFKLDMSGTLDVGLKRPDTPAETHRVSFRAVGIRQERL